MTRSIAPRDTFTARIGAALEAALNALDTLQVAVEVAQLDFVAHCLERSFKAREWRPGLDRDGTPPV